MQLDSGDWWETVEPPPALRAFQEEALESLRDLVRRGMRRLILQSPTGSGKTVIAAHAIRAAIDKGKRALFIAHRRELIHQASRKLRSLSIPHGIIMAGRPMTVAPCQVASKDTLLSRSLHGGQPLPPADLVIVDEAHRAVSTWWQALLSHYPNAVVIGPTATPARNTGKGLGDYFQGMVQAAKPSRLLAEGYLVPTMAYGPCLPDLSKVPSTHGEYVRKELARVMDTPRLVGDVVEHWLRLARDRLTIVFASGVRHSENLRDRFADAGIRAAHVDGTTESGERDAILADFAAGRTQVLCSCDVFTEGTDIPPASCAVLARPTRSRVRYLQMAGRIQRPFPGKEDALLLDHSGAVLAHGFPDEDVEWVLEKGRDAVALPPAAAPPSRPCVCPSCSFLFRGKLACPNCGEPLPHKLRKGPAQVPGTLEKMGRGGKAPAQDGPTERQRFWLKCLAVMAHRGRNATAAAAMFEGRYREKPRNVSPLPKGDQWQVPVRDLWPGFVRAKAGEKAADLFG
jgi:DNA repair protein RadD